MQVNEVQPGQVVVTDAPTNTKKNVEFGTCIWTTGIKMHPLVGKLAKILPQGCILHLRQSSSAPTSSAQMPESLRYLCTVSDPVTSHPID